MFKRGIRKQIKSLSVKVIDINADILQLDISLMYLNDELSRLDKKCVDERGISIQKGLIERKLVELHERQDYLRMKLSLAEEELAELKNLI